MSEKPRPSEQSSLETRSEFDHRRLVAIEKQLFVNSHPEGQYQRAGYPPHPHADSDPLVALAPENPRTVLQRLDAIEKRLEEIAAQLARKH